MYAKQLHCRYKPLWQWSGAGGVNDSMCVTHRWLFERRTIVDGPFFLSSPPPTSPATPPPHHPSPPTALHSSTVRDDNTWKPSDLGMPGVYPTVRSEDHNTWELIDLGGGGGGGYLTVHIEDNTWELIDLGYVGFIPQSTQRTMALGNSVTWDMWGLSHSPHRGQWHLGTPGLRM